MTSVGLLVESEKLAQAVGEFSKQLIDCAEAYGRHSEHSQ